MLESDRSSGRVPGTCNGAAGCDAEVFSANVGSRLLALALVVVAFLSCQFSRQRLGNLQDVSHPLIVPR